MNTVIVNNIIYDIFQAIRNVSMNIYLKKIQPNLYRWRANLYRWRANLYRWRANPYRWCANLYRWRANLYRWRANPYRWCANLYRWRANPYRWCANPYRWCVQFNLYLRLLGRYEAEKKSLARKLNAEDWHILSDHNLLSVTVSDVYAKKLRHIIRSCAGLPEQQEEDSVLQDIFQELTFLKRHSKILKPYFMKIRAPRLLYAGQSYYNCYYLSREMRKNGWRADVLNWDTNLDSEIYYHGEDFSFIFEKSFNFFRGLTFYIESIYKYDVYHFSNKNGISFGAHIGHWFFSNFGRNQEIYLLKSLGKVTSYSNNSCNDGVLPSNFSKWGPESVCSICIWKNNRDVCSDKSSKSWGEFRNSVIDYQCLTGGNRIDYNTAPTIHEVPQFYCLDPSVWDPNLEIPFEHKLSMRDKSSTIYIYHAVGNKDTRTSNNGVNIKSSHIYLPLVEKLQGDGVELELISPYGIPNKDVRYYQMQADIVLDMLTFGWFGANVREAMMLGKPVICYIRPEWMDTLREELPDYANELPIVSATPDTVEGILRDLIHSKEKRIEIGKRSREFAIKWHSNKNAAKHFDEIYTQLLLGNPMLINNYDT